MPRTRPNRSQMKRLDTLIALPLARFRPAIARLTADELDVLERRIAQMTVKQRWALGGHGTERHRAPIELGLLARRHDETRRKAEKQAKATAAQLRLIEFEPVNVGQASPEILERAA